MKRFPHLIYAFFSLFLVSSCKSDRPDIIVYDVKPSHKKLDEVDPVKNPATTKTYHTDTDREYEYRTGEPGNYQYHYEVTGKNSKQEKVSGHVNMEGKYGVGIFE